jgi:MipA family protein
MDCRLRRFAFTILLALAPAGVVFAEDDCKGPSTDCVAVGGWNFSLSLGAGVRTDPVVNQATIPLAVIPQFSYYGKRFFIDDLDAGVTLAESDESSLSLIASPGYDRVFFYRSDPQNFFLAPESELSPVALGTKPLVVGKDPHTGELVVKAQFPKRPRSWTYLAGPEWTFKHAGVTGQLDLLREITGHNHGTEVRAALGIPVSHAGGSWTTDIGLTWKSSAIVNYYYGARGYYEAGAALDPFLKLAFSRPLTQRWKFTAFVETERLGNAIADSPIINSRYVTTTFVGAMYSF